MSDYIEVSDAMLEAASKIPLGAEDRATGITVNVYLNREGLRAVYQAMEHARLTETPEVETDKTLVLVDLLSKASRIAEDLAYGD